MMPSNEYQEALSNATAFKQENPEEKTTAAARIYQVNDSSVRTALLRERERQTKPATSHGGHNKVLLEVQVAAIYKYVEDSYLSGYNATKAMVFAAISCLKANEVVPKPPLTMRWFRSFMDKHPELFKTLQTKPIARVRVSAADVEEVRDWFYGFRTWCEERSIKPGDVLNFDEAGFRVGVAPGEEVVVPAYVKEVSLLIYIKYYTYTNVLSYILQLLRIESHLLWLRQYVQTEQLFLLL